MAHALSEQISERERERERERVSSQAQSLGSPLAAGPRAPDPNVGSSGPATKHP